MGMQVRIVVYGTEEADVALATDAAFAEIARLDALLSDYRQDSELRRVQESTGPTVVSNELFAVLEGAMRLARQTRGRFDPTVGTLTELWRQAIDRRQLPRSDDIERAMALSGHDGLVLDAGDRTVQIQIPGLRLDLGAIAKGYVLDRALDVLVARGHNIALVEAGGDLVVRGVPPGSRGWRVEIPHLRAPGGRGCILSVTEAAVSTSGDEAQFLDVDGRRYSHIVDPRTGLGLTHRRTATVVASDGFTADGLATALTVVEEDRMGGLLELYPTARALLSAEDCQR